MSEDLRMSFRDENQIRGKRILRFCVLAITPLLLEACSYLSPHHVNVILPDNFTGPVVICKSPTGGEYPVGYSSYTLEIPPDGVLRVKDLAFLQQERTVSVYRMNGTIVPQSYVSSANQVAWRGGTWASKNGGQYQYECFVGTLHEYEASAVSKE